MSTDPTEALVKLEPGLLAAVRCQQSARGGKSRGNALVPAPKLCKVVIQHQLVVARVPFVAIGLGSERFKSDLLVPPLGDEHRAEFVEHSVRSEFEVGGLEVRKLDDV